MDWSFFVTCIIQNIILRRGNWASWDDIGACMTVGIGRALLGARVLYSDAGKFLNMLGSGGDQSIRLDVDESRLAIGVLLYKVIQVDGRVRDEEIHVYRSIIEKYLGVREDELNSFEENVLTAFKDPVYDASMMKLLGSLSLEQKRDILAFMQDISLSDREFHEFELNMVAKTSKILGLD